MKLTLTLEIPFSERDLIHLANDYKSDIIDELDADDCFENHIEYWEIFEFLDCGVLVCPTDGDMFWTDDLDLDSLERLTLQLIETLKNQK